MYDVCQIHCQLEIFTHLCGKDEKKPNKKTFFILLFLNILVLYLAPGVELI